MRTMKKKKSLSHSSAERREKSVLQLRFVRQIPFSLLGLYTCRELPLSLHYGASNPPKRVSLVELTPLRAEF